MSSEMKGMGFQLEGGDIIGMKVQGVTAEYVKGLQSAGLQLDAQTVDRSQGDGHYAGIYRKGAQARISEFEHG